MTKRTAFFLSDRTGITAETLGQSLLTQFNGVQFSKINIPFIDTVEKAKVVATRINEVAVADGVRPLVFSTLIEPHIRGPITACNAFYMDFFDAFIGPLEEELGIQSSHAMGLSHGLGNDTNYKRRIDAVNYTLAHDDGVSVREFDKADIILVGVSRCGKTPTCLYLALQYGMFAANFPLTDRDFEDLRLPNAIYPYRHKTYGLTISPERLQQIRQERMPGSRYATLATCQYELRQAEAIFRAKSIPYLDISSKSIEEIATTVVQEAKLPRRLY